MTFQKEICTYALTATLRERGLDLIDVLSTFVLQALSKEKHMDVMTLQARMRNGAVVKGEIPLHVLNTLLKRLKKSQYVETGNEMRVNKETGAEEAVAVCKRSEKGEERLNEISQTEQQLKGNVDDLCREIILYLKNKHRISLTPENAYATLMAFIRKNSDCLLQLISKTTSLHDHIFSVSRKTEKCFLDYVSFARDRNSTHFKTFCSLVYGSILRFTMFTETTDVAEIASRKMKPCLVYLDTNFAFSALGMHQEIENRAARELVDLLKKSKFEIRIFDFTIYEMQRVMRGYPNYLRYKGKYPLQGTSYGLYDRLASEQWTETMTREFIRNIRNRLVDLGFRIEEIPEHKLIEYESVDEDRRSLFVQRKPRQSKLSRTHDLAAIEIIQRKRAGRVYSIENSKVFFLTSDRVLSDFDYRVVGHMDDGSISEVILDRLLANILWLKDASLEFPVETIIAANSRHFFVSMRVWEAFYERLREQFDKNNITENDVATLFYNDFIEDALSEIDGKDVDSVTDDLISECIKKANTEREMALKTETTIIREEIESQAKQRAEEFIEQLRQKDVEVAMLKMSMNQTRDELKEAIKMLSKKRARWVTSFVILLANVSTTLILITLSLLLQSLWPVYLVPFVVVTLLGLKFYTNGPWHRIHAHYCKKYHKDMTRCIDRIDFNPTSVEDES